MTPQSMLNLRRKILSNVNQMKRQCEFIDYESISILKKAAVFLALLKENKLLLIALVLVRVMVNALQYLDRASLENQLCIKC